MTALCQGQKERYMCPSRAHCRLYADWQKVPAVARGQVASVLLWRTAGADVCGKFEKLKPKEKSPCEPLPPLPAC